MQLHLWLKKNELTQAEFARQLNIYPNQVNNLLLGKNKPSLSFAMKIKEYTNGEVTLDELFAIPKAPVEHREEKKGHNISISVTEIREMIKNMLEEFRKDRGNNFLNIEITESNENLSSPKVSE